MKIIAAGRELAKGERYKNPVEQAKPNSLKEAFDEHLLSTSQLFYHTDAFLWS